MIGLLAVLLVFSFFYLDVIKKGVTLVIQMEEKEQNWNCGPSMSYMVNIMSKWLICGMKKIKMTTSVLK